MKTALLVLVVALAACSSDSGSSGTPAADTATAADTAAAVTDEGQSEDAMAPGDGHTAPPSCWMPDAPASGVTMDCEALCKQIQTCLPEDTSCEDGCKTFTLYVTAGAATAVNECVLAEPCGYTETGELLASCLQKGVAAGTVTRSDGGKAACEAVMNKAAECGLDLGQSFGGICELFIPIFVPEAADKVSACKDAPCGELSACIGLANCLFN